MDIIIVSFSRDNAKGSFFSINENRRLGVYLTVLSI